MGRSGYNIDDSDTNLRQNDEPNTVVSEINHHSVGLYHDGCSCGQPICNTNQNVSHGQGRSQAASEVRIFKLSMHESREQDVTRCSLIESKHDRFSSYDVAQEIRQVGRPMNNMHPSIIVRYLELRPAGVRKEECAENTHETAVHYYL